MQPKVSMVMPCYNKADYIGNMFDSILAQKWDNIELILVNDGSTDATREIIAAYEPKFRARGFETVIVDQENRGVAAAVHEGLKRFTGDYVCQIDADDELDPEYVSVMAGFLEQNKDYDYVTCGSAPYKDTENGRAFLPANYPIPKEGWADMTERYLLSRICEAPWAYMVRGEYIEKCRMIKNYHPTIRGSQEPDFMVPLTACGGKFKPFTTPLYYVNTTPPFSQSRPEADEEAYRRTYARYKLSELAIGALPESVTDSRKKALFVLAAYTRFLCQCLLRFQPNGPKRFPKNNFQELLDEYIHRINAFFAHLPPLQAVAPEDLPYLLIAVEAAILGDETPHDCGYSGRIIAWGALGRRGRRWLPWLKGTAFEPTELWDAAGDGKTIKKPNPKSLTNDDLVLVMPLHVKNEICAAIEEGGGRVLLLEEVARQIARRKYPQFYNGGLKFYPRRLTNATKG